LLRGIFFSPGRFKFGALNLLRMLYSESQVDSTMPAIHGTGGILRATFWTNNGIHVLILFLADNMATSSLSERVPGELWERWSRGSSRLK
jgi:hypothetical protein